MADKQREAFEKWWGSDAMEIDETAYPGLPPLAAKRFALAAWLASGSTAWIPCEQELPPDSRDVLVISNKSARLGWCKNPSTGTWRVYYMGGTEDADVTHWQPLPAPPSAQEGKSNV